MCPKRSQEKEGMNITKLYLKKKYVIAVLFVLFCNLPASNWPHMRGPDARGHGETKTLLTRWSETKNVMWKTSIPGTGWSSPVVYDNQIWLTTATEEGRKRHAIAVDRSSGEILHNIIVVSMKLDKVEFIHPFNTHASPSPVLESGRVYVSFGSKGLACIDTYTGKTIWFNDEIKIDHFRGSGSSPVIYKNLLLLHYDGYDKQMIVAYDKRTGKIAWKTDRSVHVSDNGDLRKAFSIPLVLKVKGVDQLVSTAAQCVYGYEPLTGKELWSFPFLGLGHSASAMPNYDEGTELMYINTGFGKAKLLAIRVGGSGDISKSHLAWTLSVNVPRMGSSVIVDGIIYMVDDKGFATATDARTGKSIWKKRLGSVGYASSPVYAGGHIYFFDHKKGIGTVLKPGKKFKVVAENKLDDGVMSSPAVSENSLIVRSKTHLYRLEKK